MEQINEPNKAAEQNQDNSVIPKDAPAPYIKPYISAKKHGENGKLFEDLFHDDRYKKNKGRNYH